MGENIIPEIIPHWTKKDFCTYFNMSSSSFDDWRYPDEQNQEKLKKLLEEKEEEGKKEENLIRTIKPFGKVLIPYDEVQRLEKLKKVG